MPRIDFGRPGVLDADFLAEQLGFLLELVVLNRQSDAGVDAVGGPAASGYDGVVGQRDDVQNGRFDVLGPPLRQRNVWQSLVWQW